MKTIVCVVAIVVGLVSCSAPNQKQNQGESQSREAFPEAFDQALKAHGGLEQWNAYGTLTFDEISGEDTVFHLIDLKNRNERMEKKGAYKIGFTQDTVVVYPTPDSFPAKNPRFYHNLRFYFFAIPFVTADAGAHQHSMPPAELQGVTYNRVKITFGDGVGIAPKDQYVLWFEQDTHRLKMINYSVTYFDESRAEQYNAIVYSQWQEVGGLIVPLEMTGYKWEDGQLGEERYRKYTQNVRFAESRPSASVFTNLK